MPAPSTSLATLRPDLGGSMEDINLEADRLRFIGLRLFRPFEANEQAGTFGKIVLAELLKNVDTRRSSGGAYSQSDFQFTADSYATQEHGVVHPVDDRASKIYRNYFDAELAATRIARHRVLLNLELRIAAKVATVTNTGAGSDWTDHANATPLDDVLAAVLAAYDASGLWPNAIALSQKAFKDLINCEQLIDRLKHDGHTDVKAGNLSAAVVASALDLRQVLVGGGSKVTSTEGQTAAVGPIWPAASALVCTVAETDMIEEPCLGRTIHWGEDGSSIGCTIETYRDEDIRGDKVRARMDTDEKLLHPQSAYLLTGLTG